MKEEILPVLEERNGRIEIIGTIGRLAAHDPAHPVLHATAVIAAVLPDGRILFADKTKKQQAKGRLPGGTAHGFHVIDIFGGHLSCDDLTREDHELGMQEATFRKCALRELSEELLIEDARGRMHPLPVEESRLTLIGYYRMENDHNRELSMAYLYRLPGEDHYASVDTLKENGRETVFSQPLLYLPVQAALEAYFDASRASGFLFDDAFGRIVEPDRGRRLLQLITAPQNADDHPETKGAVSAHPEIE